MLSSGEDIKSVDGYTGGHCGDEIEEQQRTYHPLLNDVILDSLVNHLRRNDLKECRAVCQKWNLLTISFIRSKFRVTIHGCQPKNGRNIQNFVDTFRMNKLGIPFSKFKLGSFSTTDRVGQEFLNICGDSITEISFLDEVFQVQNVSEILKSTPKLKSLRIPSRLRSQSGNFVKLFCESENFKPKLSSLKKFHVLNEYKGRRVCCPTFLEEIITAAPNIAHLCIIDHYRYQRNLIVPDSLEVLRLIEKLGRESSLSTIHLRSFTTEHVEILNRMKLKGLNLKGLICDSYSRFSHAFQLVPILKESLRYFKIMGTLPVGIGYKIPKLRYLGISTSSDIRSTCANLNNNFPVVERLKIFSEDPDMIHTDLFAEFEPCPTIKTLGFYNVSYPFTAFNRILTVFPMLSKLRLWIRVDGVQIVTQIWTEMRQLVSLTIYGRFPDSENMDSLLTGISNGRLQEIGNLVNGLEVMTVKLRKETILDLVNEHSQRPSVRNLTNLRYLKLRGIRPGYGGGQRYLTDLSAYLGFYSMKHLKHLVVKRCAFTKTCCEILTTEMDLDYWRFMGSDLNNIIPNNEVLPF